MTTITKEPQAVVNGIHGRHYGRSIIFSISSFPYDVRKTIYIFQI